MHIFFIDNDGVIRPNSSPNDYQPNQENLRNLLEVIDSVNGKVVVSSTWKLAFSDKKFSDIFGKHRYIGCTPDISEHVPHQRLREIQKYLSDNNLDGVTYTIIDDKIDLFPRNTKNLFICDGDIGFSSEDAIALKTTLCTQSTTNITKKEHTMSSTTESADLDEKISVTVSMTRRELNRLTHVITTSAYELAVRRACWDKIARFSSPIPDLDAEAYADDTVIEEN